jgi:hypothetical protein
VFALEAGLFLLAAALAFGIGAPAAVSARRPSQSDDGAGRLVRRALVPGE